MIVTSFLVTTSVYFAIGIVCCVLIFPETMNHSYLSSSAELVEKLKGILTLQEDVLEADPQEIHSGAPLATKIIMARAGMIAQLQQRERNGFPCVEADY